jgi:hypothetical protein
MTPNDARKFLQCLTDFEIFEYFGVYLPYRNRANLIDRYMEALRDQLFMYPVRRTVVTSVNSETISGAAIADVTVFMVCYGTIERYYTYELSDLIGAFFRDPETGIASFRHPEDTTLNFTDAEITTLKNLLECFEAPPDITTLKAVIDRILIDAQEFIAGDREFMAAMALVSKETRQHIRAFLHGIFECGMYMRRWKGPGHPYPINRHDTETPNWADEPVQQSIGRVFHIIRDMGRGATDFAMRLKMCQYRNNGTIQHGNRIFREEWDAVVTNTQCIRMASTNFIGTGYHYLRVLFNETIPGLDIKQVVTIM